MLRRRSWREISSAASRLTLRMELSWSLPPFVPPGIDVDGHERLGFIHDEVAAALEVDLA